MKYVVLAGAIYLFVLCSGICEAVPTEDKNVVGVSAVIQAQKEENISAAPVVKEEVPGDKEADAEVKHIDRENDDDQDVAQVGVMSPGQSYDENSGFPDVVDSDSSMDL
jgi:predicted  nucleic acid-binding Zn-ribbon protein